MSKTPKSAKLRADARSIAEEKLAAMPEVSEGRVAVPFAYDAKPPFKLARKSFVGARHQKVAMGDLVALQPVVKRKKVRRFLRTAPHYSAIPTVVRTGGKYYIADGHHRLTADALLGRAKARVNTLDLDLGGDDQDENGE